MVMEKVYNEFVDIVGFVQKFGQREKNISLEEATTLGEQTGRPIRSLTITLKCCLFTWGSFKTLEGFSSAKTLLINNS